MDALKFIEERNRMCDYYRRGNELSGCAECPAFQMTCLSTRSVTAEYIAAVEQWSKEHPRKTRQDVFLAHYPDAALNDGVLRICPRNVYKPAKINCNITTCSRCKKAFWLQEVE